MKKYFLAFVFSLFFLSGCGLDKDLTQTGNVFFDLVKDQNFEMAYLSTAQEFQNATTLEGLTYMIENYDLTTFENIKWTEATAEDSQGRLIGMIDFPDGKQLEAQMNIILKNDIWRIQSIRFTNPNLAEEANLPKSPDDFLSLINTTMQLFIQDLEEKDFTDSYNAVSQLWKDQNTQEEFTQAFEAFLELENPDFSYVAEGTPELLRPPQAQQTNDNQVVMILQGQYANPNDGGLLFDLNYVKEGEAWKLAGIKLSIQNPTDETATE